MSFHQRFNRGVDWRREMREAARNFVLQDDLRGHRSWNPDYRH